MTDAAPDAKKDATADAQLGFDAGADAASDAYEPPADAGLSDVDTIKPPPSIH